MDKYFLLLVFRQLGWFWRDQWRVIKTNYRYGRFLFAWFWLRMSYLIDSPYWVSLRFQRKRKSEDLHVYGETPLSALMAISDRAGIQEGQHIFELGAGSGFTCLWLNAVRRCRVTAVERIPLFCWRLKRTAKRAGLSSIDVRCEDYLQASFEGADWIYLYGSNLEDEVIRRLAQQLLELPDQVKVVTVSYPLANYAALGLFPLIDHFVVDFEWGQAEVFIQSIR